MKRRSFLQFLGLAPVLAKMPTAEQEPSVIEALNDGIVPTWDGTVKTVTDDVFTGLRYQGVEIIEDNVYQTAPFKVAQANIARAYGEIGRLMWIDAVNNGLKD